MRLLATFLRVLKRLLFVFYVVTPEMQVGLPDPRKDHDGKATDPTLPRATRPDTLTFREESSAIREVLGLSPNADSTTVLRTLASLTKRRTESEDDTRGLHHETGFTTRNPQREENPYEPDWTDQRRPLRTEGNVLPETLHHKDRATVCDIARKWNLRFDGNKDPISFLERIEELAASYSLPLDDVVQALPELLHGMALLWYRNAKDTWRTYNEFRRAFEAQFLPPGYRRNLDGEIRRRTQGENEPFRNFVVALTTLMRRRGAYTALETVDVIYANMRPEYKLMVRRQDCTSLATMTALAEDYESYRRESSAYRPPPTPATSLVPETAYTHRRRVDRASETSAAEESWRTKTDRRVKDNAPWSNTSNDCQRRTRRKEIDWTDVPDAEPDAPAGPAVMAVEAALSVDQKLPDEGDYPRNHHRVTERPPPETGKLGQVWAADRLLATLERDSGTWTSRQRRNKRWRVFRSDGTWYCFRPWRLRSQADQRR